MREETRRRLDRTLRIQRMKIMALAVAAVAACGALLYLTGLDARVEDHRVPGHVERVSIPNIKSASQAVAVDVALDDGRHVHVIATRSHEPHVGDRVEVTEHRHGTGRITFTWR